MQCIYYDGIDNVGDELNRYIWPSLFGQPQCDRRTALLGVGTLLDAAFSQRLDHFEKILVLGSGAGYGTLPVVDGRWKIYAVRGVRTCTALQLPAEMGVADAAYLLGALNWDLMRARRNDSREVIFIPHHSSLKYVDWGLICRQAGVAFLSPTAPVPVFVEKLANARHVVAEAMHGAILADIMRIPWSPFKFGQDFLDSKWFDWMEMFGLQVEVMQAPGFYDPDRCYESRGRLFHMQRSLKARLARHGLGRKKWQGIMPPGPSDGAEGRQLSELIEKIAARDGHLSDDLIFERQVERLYEKAARLASEQWNGGVTELTGSPREIFR